MSTSHLPLWEEQQHQQHHLNSLGGSKGKRRPGLREFDSLQDLLEQAGYKETRIFTPIASKTPASPPQVSQNDASSITLVSPPRGATSIGKEKKEGALGWFNTVWQHGSTDGEQDTNSKNRRGGLNRKQSEPVLSKRGRKAVQKGWMGFWGGSKGAETHGESQHSPPPPLPPLPSTTSTTDSIQPRPPLRHAPSTSHLWQGSLRHHRKQLSHSRSFPASLASKQDDSRALNRKESYDGARAVAGVGFGSAKTTNGDLIFVGRGKQRISLRQAFGQDADACERPAEEESGKSHRYDHTSRQEWKDSISSLVDLEENRVTQDSKEEEQRLPANQDNELTGPSSIASISLFSTTATPVLSRHDAVALRNVGCLDFAQMGEEPGTRVNQSNSKALRKMRSVDALELALAKMEKQQNAVSKAPSALHNTIPESFSADSLTNDDFANAATTLVGQDGRSGGQEIHRASTPRLVITSPNGVRSPQPLVLEGCEFEPRSISPEVIRVFRPVASRQSGWKMSASVKSDGGVAEEERRGRGGKGTATGMDGVHPPSNIPRRSLSKRRSRPGKGEESGERDKKERFPIPPPKLSRKRGSRSCNDLRTATVDNVVPVAGKLTGSEQIRALRRVMIKRGEGQPSSSVDSALHSSKRASIPSAPSEENEDDPFRDFVAVAKAMPNTSSKGEAIKRPGRSPSLFEQSQRRPFGQAVNHQQSTQHHSQSSSPDKERTLARMQSGVGIACLVEKRTNRSHSSSHSDENTQTNPLLDSPTANVVKKRSSRTRLGQR